MTKNERVRLAREISQQLVPELAAEVIRRLQALGLLPAAATSAAESASPTCPSPPGPGLPEQTSASKDPTATATSGDVDWYSLGAECGADLARRARMRPASSPKPQRAPRRKRAG
jgi:hypothetical protein